MIAAAIRGKQTIVKKNPDGEPTDRNCEVDAAQNTKVENGRAEATLMHEPRSTHQKRRSETIGKKEDLPDICN